MITLSFLKLLEDEGFGTIDTDLFFQKQPLDKKGLYISDIASTLSRGTRKTQSFEILARGDSDVSGYQLLTEILQFMHESYAGVCELPPVPPISTVEYSNVTILPTSSITNVGLDAKNRIIYSIQGQIIY